MARLRQGLLADVFVAGSTPSPSRASWSSWTLPAPGWSHPLRTPAVILVAGCNKIVPTCPYAQERIRHFVPPANAKRLGARPPAP